MKPASSAAERTLGLPFVSPTERAVLQSAREHVSEPAAADTRYLVLRHGGRDVDRWRVLYAFGLREDAEARYEGERRALRQGELALVELTTGGGATMHARTALPRRGPGGSYRRGAR